uniref:RanBP2-type domain-containing protein n=1 Tax=Eutreptiella gymnastica TaxID=73025 RepID=A0A7S4LAY3_9EUGL
MDDRYPPDWVCHACQHVNFARRATCELCNTPRSPFAAIAYAPTHLVKTGQVPATDLSSPGPMRSAGFGFGGGGMGGRGARPVGTLGMGMGSMRPMTLLPGDWCCPNMSCGHVNFAKQTDCQRCGVQKRSSEHEHHSSHSSDRSQRASSASKRAEWSRKQQKRSSEHKRPSSRSREQQDLALRTGIPAIRPTGHRL